MIKDILIWKNANGGDISLEYGEVLPQLVFICLFGGNVEAITRGNELSTELREDYWANSLLFKNDVNKQFNSETEKTLLNIALNSQGRVKVLQSIENDLKTLKTIADIKTEVYLLSSSRLKIEIKLSKPNNDEKILQIIWDNFKKSAIIEKII